MFAVPGWSLSADKLRSEKGADAAATPAAVPANAPSKKRKRPGRGPKEVTDDNVADLWARVIEKKGPGKTAKGGKKEKKESEEPSTTTKQEEMHKESAETSEAKEPRKTKKQKRSKEESTEVKEAEENNSVAEPKIKKPKEPKEQPKASKGEKAEVKKAEVKEMKDIKTEEKKKPKEDKPKEKKPKEKKTTEKKPTDKKPADKKAADKTQQPAWPPSPQTALTPLQASMRAKLVSARFRHLNETLYTRPSAEALRLFADAPDMFQAYHEGFRQQVAVWPSNPVDGYVAAVRRRAGASGKKGKLPPKRTYNYRDPTDTLPRTRGTCHIADVGCGDARLAAALAPAAARLRVEVASFDLHADPANPHITAAADAADLPLPPDSMDVVVFCLALMGTNWLAFVEEAYRALRWKGELWVAEIKSRFTGAAELRAVHKRSLAGTPVAHSVGYRRKMGIKNGKKKPEEDDPDLVAAATAEIDGDETAGATTDVAAFVHALRRRGFVLDDHGTADGDGTTSGKPPAIDLENKMFVKMRFLKAAPALVGKNATAAPADANKRKFLDEAGPSNNDPLDDPAVEAKILKPCVYKLR